MTSNLTGDDSLQRGAIAPAWHTVLLLLILFGFSFASARAGSLSPLSPNIGRAVAYIAVIIFEWAVVAFIWFGVQQRNVRIADLVGGRWARPVQILRDLLIAIAFLIVVGTVTTGLNHFVKASPNQAIRNLLPHGPVEVAFYLATCLTAGFCEELIYRGYLQRQFSALTQNFVGGITLQAVVFALGHAYQGWRYVVLIAVLAIMLGLLAHWRKSLRPGMIAHALQDSVSGIVASHILR